jgi:hypothetical protein
VKVVKVYDVRGCRRELQQVSGAGCVEVLETVKNSLVPRRFGK